MDPEPKINLSDFTKIPPKEFEKNFRDWLDRDDVARSLQAQLRMDLIKNFNKTALGRQILSQATSTNKPYGAASQQRLTLSPMVLALNTLVAEFLYAENCHFSLSVFCTEIPFRNTLPDFETSRYFRFTDAEICEILEAVSGMAKYGKELRNEIVGEYETSSTTSLLLLILKHFINFAITQESERLQKKPETQQKATQSSEAWLPPAEETKTETFPEVKRKKSSNDLRHINKYLIALSNKVKNMSRQIYLLQDQQNVDAVQMFPHPRQFKTASAHSLKSLNRSLETITGNLKKMALAKRKSKRIGVIVTAIETMSNQFEKCATNLEKLYTNFECKANSPKRDMSTSMPEMSYTEWITELRSSKHGQRFLDKVENSLRKALNKQKKILSQELEMKLTHQKDLLKIRYKEKFMKDLPQRDPSVEFNKLNASVEQQLEQLELKHCEMVQRLHDEQQNVMQNAVPSKIMPVTMVEVKPTSVGKAATPTAVKSSERQSRLQSSSSSVRSTSKSPVQSAESPKSLPNSRTRSRQAKPLKKRCQALKKAVDSNYQEMIQQIVADERKVDNLVFDAKLRLQQLELESNQLEQNFHQYLERQKAQKEICREASATMWNNYLLEKNKIEKRYQMLQNATKSVHEIEDDDDSDREFRKYLDEMNASKLKVTPALESNQEETTSSSSVKCKNAILEAKAKFFQIDKSIDSIRAGKCDIGRRNKCDAESNNGTAEINPRSKSKSKNRGALKHNLKTIDSQRSLNHRKVLQSKTNLLKTAEPVSKTRTLGKGSYDTETEATTVETDESEDGARVLFKPNPKVKAKIQTLDTKLHDQTHEQLKMLTPTTRLKPWTNTIAKEQKVVETLYICPSDKIGDYKSDSKENKDENLKPKSATTTNLWEEEQPSTSRMHREIESKVSPTLSAKSSTAQATTSTTMVLQQSMAKMNRLFQREQQRRRQQKLKEQGIVFMQQPHKKQTPTTNEVERTTQAVYNNETTPTRTTISTTTSNTSMQLQQDLKRFVDDDNRNNVANTNVAPIAEKTESVAVETTVAEATRSVVTSTIAMDNVSDQKRYASDQLNKTVATLSSWRTTMANEPSSSAKLTALKVSHAGTNTEQQSAISSHNLNEIQAMNFDIQKMETAYQQQQQQQQQYLDLREQFLKHNVAESSSQLAGSREDVNSDAIAGAAAVGTSSTPAMTVGSSQLDAAVVALSIDDYDDLVLRPISGSTMSMSSLLALKFSTVSVEIGNGADSGEVGEILGDDKNENDENEFWAK